jgi:hypothetical protein
MELFRGCTITSYVVPKALEIGNMCPHISPKWHTFRLIMTPAGRNYENEYRKN